MVKKGIDIAGRKGLAVSIAKEAGRLLKSHFGRDIQIKSKGDRDLVTDIDLKAEEKIVTPIKKTYPKDNILSEETEQQTCDSDFKWIIDPLDGTHNYIREIENFGISIALAYKNRVILGVIYVPMRYIGRELTIILDEKDGKKD